jgi:hypothetical protein
VKTMEPPGRMLPLPYFAARKAAPIAQTKEIPRRLDIHARQVAELQGFAGCEDQMVEAAERCEQRLHRRPVGEIEGMTFGARGQSCQPLVDSCLPAGGNHY